MQFADDLREHDETSAETQIETAGSKIPPKGHVCQFKEGNVT